MPSSTDPLIGGVGATGTVADQRGRATCASASSGSPCSSTLAGTGYRRGFQNTRTPLLVAAGSSILNLSWSSSSSTASTSGSGPPRADRHRAAGGAAVYLRRVTRRAGPARAARPDWSSIRRLARVGRDLSSGPSRSGLAAPRHRGRRPAMGADDLAAHQVAFEIWSFLALPWMRIAIAGQAIIGRFLGAATRPAPAGPAAACSSGASPPACSAVCSWWRSDPGWVSCSATIEDVVALAGFLLWWVALLQPVNGVVFALDGLLMGAGDARFLAQAMVGAFLVFVLAAGLVLATGAGIGWLWAVLGVLMTARLVPLLRRFDQGACWLSTAQRAHHLASSVDRDGEADVRRAARLPPLEATAVLMPTTSPAALTSGPPELPELMAASVWIRPARCPTRSRCDRSSADTMPWVTVGPPSRARALPMATTSSPTCSVGRSAERGAAIRPLVSLDLEHGDVVGGRLPTTVPCAVVLVAVTVTVTSSAPSTTWALVRIVAVGVEDDAGARPGRRGRPRPRAAAGRRDLGLDRHHGRLDPVEHRRRRRGRRRPARDWPVRPRPTTPPSRTGPTTASHPPTEPASIAVRGHAAHQGDAGPARTACPAAAARSVRTALRLRTDREGGPGHRRSHRTVAPRVGRAEAPAGSVGGAVARGSMPTIQPLGPPRTR